MFDVPLETVVPLIRGAFSVERTRNGIVPSRLPERATLQVPDAFTREVFRQTSGIRLSLTTAAATLELEIATSQIALADVDSPVHPVKFDLMVDGRDQASEVVERVSVRSFELFGELLDESEQVFVTLRFEGLPSLQKVVELWFPQNAVVELAAFRADAEVAELSDLRPRWVHYGSSISHCSEAHSPTRTWPAVAALLGGVELQNVGVGGSCHLEQFVARAIRDTPADCVSLKVGTNIAGQDTLKYRTFVPAVHGFLDTVRDGHPEIPILVVAPIIRPILETRPGPAVPTTGGASQTPSAPIDRNALSLRRIREILEEIVRLRGAEDPNLYYLDGLRLFGEADLGDLPDGVHPSADGYIRIGERFAEAAFAAGGCFAHLHSADVVDCAAVTEEKSSGLAG